ncbi:60S ribosomal protein L31 [Platanthera zijinensis]|uniref:60S ribosomal protein L31 n=1 Tax=Platanthera zijinensis TaxID=2320716 RepID=A0AAP0G7J6_9ASPA
MKAIFNQTALCGDEIQKQFKIRINLQNWEDKSEEQPRGIRSVPRRVRVRIARKRNEEEDAKEEWYSLVTVAEIPPEGLKGLGTKVVDETE